METRFNQLLMDGEIKDPITAVNGQSSARQQHAIMEIVLCACVLCVIFCVC